MTRTNDAQSGAERPQQENPMIKCLSCGYEGEIGTYWPTVSIYSDIRCPQCGSTSNAHNREYSKQLHAKMAEITKEEQNARK